jgi:hypothetical protein
MKYDPSNLQHEPQNSNLPVDEAGQVGHESLAASVPMHAPQPAARGAEPLAAAAPSRLPHPFRPRLDGRVAQRTAELLTRVTASITLSGEPGA